MDKKEYNRIYRQKNITILKTYDKAYYEENKELKQKQKLSRYYVLKDDPIYKAKKKKYYETHKEQALQSNRKYRASNPEKFRQYEFERREKIFTEKAGRPRPSTCEVCGSGEKIVYDHDHATGKFRGWICFSCNTALGHARDNVEVMYKLIAYLETNKLLNNASLSQVKLPQ